MKFIIMAGVWALIWSIKLSLLANEAAIGASPVIEEIDEKAVALDLKIQQVQGERHRVKHRLAYENTNAIPLRIRAKEVEAELVRAKQEYREQLRIREHAAAAPLLDEARIADLQEHIKRLEPAHREALAELHDLLDDQPAVKELDQRLQSMVAERQMLLNQKNNLTTDEL